MIACFILISMLLTVLEITLRSRGIILPLLPCWIFYLSVLRDNEKNHRKQIPHHLFDLGAVGNVLYLPVRVPRRFNC